MVVTRRARHRRAFIWWLIIGQTRSTSFAMRTSRAAAASRGLSSTRTRRLAMVPASCVTGSSIVDDPFRRRSTRSMSLQVASCSIRSPAPTPTRRADRQALRQSRRRVSGRAAHGPQGRRRRAGSSTAGGHSAAGARIAGSQRRHAWRSSSRSSWSWPFFTITDSSSASLQPRRTSSRLRRSTVGTRRAATRPHHRQAGVAAY